MQAFIFFYAVIAVFLVAFATIVTGFVLNSITGPVNKLCDATKQIAGGDFSTRVAIEGKDEIATLAESVNDMSEHLEELVRQIKEDERKMRYAELRLLQEQINPHFLQYT